MTAGKCGRTSCRLDDPHRHVGGNGVLMLDADPPSPRLAPVSTRDQARLLSAVVRLVEVRSCSGGWRNRAAHRITATVLRRICAEFGVYVDVEPPSLADRLLRGGRS